ncbi:MAG TPA: nucleoside recognition domain-containing protein [Synergistaceae bacterium]|nr:nucleoside recognition domain-containing protein [Synergistaceae bacterium]HPJ25283.1 nucleoside recognition domain-containing protein [Synergistaceae bacterium]HPQ37026.1 nucleoside recognition domain-containing protein [Synergistaceae bacterium]
MNDISQQKPSKRPLGTGEVLKFLIPSLIGAIAFLMPIPQGTTMNTLLGMAIDFGKGTLKAQLPLAAMILVCAGALFTLYAVLAKPKFVRENEFLSELFIVTPFWVFSRLLGAFFYPLIYFKIGPEIIWHMDNGGTPGFLLAPALLVVFSVLAFIVPFLTDFGLMEYIGTMARPILRPLFTLPGRAAVDCVASWVGSSSVGVVITTKMHRDGYYSDREASVIATCFSVISIAYIYLMADFVGLPHMYFQLLISIYIVTFILALLMPRIWPLRGMKDDYSGKKKQQISEDLPEGFTLGEWALHSAVEKAKDQGAHTVIVTCVRTFVSLIVSTMPLVISWGTLVLIIANSTPIFQWIATPFAWMLSLVHIPEAVDVAPAFVLSYADQFLAAVIGADRVAEAAKFMCAGISATGLIYMTEVGVLILNSTIPLGAGKLTVIYVIRAVLSVFLLAPFALYFCG